MLVQEMSAREQWSKYVTIMCFVFDVPGKGVYKDLEVCGETYTQ